MDYKIQPIIDKIHDLGIKQAEEKAQEVIADAEKRAQACIEDAEAKAESIVKKAERDAVQLRSSAEAALQQAGRDLLISVEQKLRVLFDTVIYTSVKTSLSTEKLSELLTKIITQWLNTSDTPVELMLPEEEQQQIEALFRAQLSEKMLSGISIFPVSGVSAGFRISRKGEGAYYEISARSIADILSEYLSARFQNIVKKASQE